MVSLDESQLKFIRAPEGNIRLLAPAGCGKTLCLLYRCKHLAESSRSRQRFLIVTFTRAARDELRSRINEESQFAPIRDQTEITTLNSWGFRRLRNVKHSVKIIRSNSYKSTMDNLLQPVWINRDHERIEHAIKKHYQAPKELMKMIDSFMSLGFDHRRLTSISDFSGQWERLIAHGLGWWLQEQIDQLIQFEILEEMSDTNPAVMRREVFDAWYRFWCKAVQLLFDSATVTLDGQKYFAWQVERKNIEDKSLLSGAASYDHVFVDEFQDINPLDLALVRTIVERSRATLTITGDDDQAIYEWRGATPEYILYPEEHFNSPFVTFTLGKNYRSPKNIVEMSQRLIANNKRRVPKQIAAHGTKKAKIEIKRVHNLSESLEFVHNLVESSFAQGKSRSQVALIGRLKSQIIPYQILFASTDIPFCAAEDLLIHLSDTYKNLQVLLDIKAGAYGRQSTRQVVEDILFLCGFVKRYKLSRKDEGSLRKVLQKSRPNSFLNGVDALAGYRGELKRVKNEDGRINIEMADAIRTFVNSEKVSDALYALSDNFAGLRKDFFKAEDDIFFKDPPFLQLAEYAMRYDSDFDSFIYDISEARATLYKAPYDDDIDDLSKTPVHLMTAQRAKGKEFERVVLLDVLDGVWPHKNADGHKKREAERRVFYVAFTRAKNQVTMLVNKPAPDSPYIEELGL